MTCLPFARDDRLFAHCATRVFLAALLVSSLLGGVVAAQTSSSQISGRVIDASRAVVIGAMVTLTNQATGDMRTTKTDEAGNFVFVAVQPGEFTVSVTASSFKQLTKRDLRLEASERLSTGDLKLEIGQITESVNVTAEVTPIQSESAERSAVIDSNELSTLMTIGRDPLGLLRVLPGVVRDGGGSSELGTQSAGTIAGVRESSNAVSIDGVLGNPRGDGNNLDTPLNMDAVGEIKVMLNSYQAEYGQSAGAIINLTTKSGTQHFHGSGYYYSRNEAFNANSFFNSRKGLPRGVYRFNT